MQQCKKLDWDIDYNQVFCEYIQMNDVIKELSKNIILESIEFI